MISYLIRRVLATIPVMAVVAVFVFLMLYLAPGDPAVVIAGEYATDQQIQEIRDRLGYDRPIHIQFAIWLDNLAHGDLGTSIFTKIDVLTLIVQRIEPTLVLTLSTMTIAIMVAVPIGIAAAVRAGSLLDRSVMIFALIGFSVPVFVLGYCFVYIFAVTLCLLPVQGYVPLMVDPLGCIASITLPATTLGLVFAALIARITRASMLEVLNNDYIRTARAKGLADSKVILIHAFKNAAIPVVTTIGAGVAMLINGSVVVESVFAIPGVGRLIVDAILRRDYPIIQGTLILFSAVFVLINIVVDIIYTLLNPRIRYQ